MKVTSLRYLDAKFHHPSLGASPPNRGKYRYCKSICLPPEVSLLLKRRSVNKFRHRYTMLWPLSVVLVQRTVGYPSTSWASCFIISYFGFGFTSAYNSIMFCCVRRNVESCCHTHDSRSTVIVYSARACLVGLML